MNGLLTPGNGIKGILTDSYHVGRVVIGLGTFIGVFYIYLNHYTGINASSRNDLGIILVVGFFFGVAMLSGGLDGWKKIYKRREKLEKVILKVEYKKKRKELQTLRGIKNKF